MSKKLTADIRVAVQPELRERLEREAQRNRRSLSSMTRVLLERALYISERTPGPLRGEYEISLTTTELTRLEKRGYEPVPANGDDDE